ncbi:hypothetical protein HYU96_01940 [Candidatus Daviesbacteria bacterium]|nr:hypothetical protein [Candidatus Daviesbacteria bacterium]
MKNPQEWKLRFGTAGQYLTLLLNHLDIFGFNPQQEKNFQEELQSELERSLLHLEGRQTAILEALGQSGKDIER